MRARQFRSPQQPFGAGPIEACASPPDRCLSPTRVSSGSARRRTSDPARQATSSECGLMEIPNLIGVLGSIGMLLKLQKGLSRRAHSYATSDVLPVSDTVATRPAGPSSVSQWHDPATSLAACPQCLRCAEPPPQWCVAAVRARTRLTRVGGAQASAHAASARSHALLSERGEG